MKSGAQIRLVAEWGSCPEFSDREQGKFPTERREDT